MLSLLMMMMFALVACSSQSEVEERIRIVAADNRIDVVRPDAPELASLGDLPIGVRRLEFTNADQLDVLNASSEGIPRYDRPLTVELWYPAVGEGLGEADNEYRVITRDAATEAVLLGRAVRDAAPRDEGPYPLIILSHGYPGNRFLLSHFGENLASKGYVVASIDHTDSTYSDQAAFSSTLLNRPLDQLFVLDALAQQSADSSSALHNLIDADNSGVIGYSMGGYGILNAIGAGLSPAVVGIPSISPNRVLELRQAGNPEYLASLDERIRAAIAIGPWGMQNGFWNAEGLAGVSVPVMIMAGSIDDVSDYAGGIVPLFEGLVNSERYLLSFQRANHNAAAPIPAPREVLMAGTGFDHYADPVWDTRRMNNIAQHFATAFFDQHLRGQDSSAFFDVLENSDDGVWSVDDDGNPDADHSYWLGFPNRTAVGLRLQYRSAP